MTVDEFVPQVDSEFRIDLSDGAAMTLTLIAADPDKRSAPEGFRTPFSLRFKSDSRIVLSQDIYTLRRPGSDDLALFLVPYKQTEEGVFYAVSIN
ncbi:DUF6916 family protein [Sphingomonas immobilis]|uniref:DUF6916 domain-containing protein n=1 Tax=Sphingomonas immobilis TaxID=3063997 RepID=A0ABT9A1K4_9SPHN|nr:hypothetical protein [Sphingomonas sp. CA1-15]MDO7843140.1 hypothetical protein [Sphingomonas sp. CA1-15]